LRDSQSRYITNSKAKIMTTIKAIVLSIMMTTVFLIQGCDQEANTSVEAQTRMALFKLARMNGCTDCHRISATVIGPSWNDIAERYKNVPFPEAKALLVESVKKGSKGKFITLKGADGMPPLEKRVESNTIERLVEYILSLNRGPTS